MKISFRLFTIIGVLLFAYILFSSDIGRVFSIVSTANIPFLFFGFLVSFVSAFLKSEKWRMLLRTAGQNYGVFRSFVVWMISYAYGFITPARAGDFVRVFYLDKDLGMSKSKGFLVCLLDRLMDLAALLFTSLVFYTIVFEFPQLVFVSCLALLILSYVVLLLTDRFIHLFPGRVRTFYLKARSFVKDVSKNYSIKSLILPFLLGVVSWFFSFSQMYIVMLAFGKTVSYFLVGAGVSVSLLVSLLPVSIGGLGTTELTFFTIFQVFSMEEIIALSFAFNLISLWLPALVGFLFNVFNGVEMEL